MADPQIKTADWQARAIVAERLVRDASDRMNELEAQIRRLQVAGAAPDECYRQVENIAAPARIWAAAHTHYPEPQPDLDTTEYVRADLASVKRLKDRIDSRLDAYLCEMKPDYDDSIAGFNEAWDIVRKAFAEVSGV